MVANGYLFSHKGNRYVVTGNALNGLDQTLVYLCQELKVGGQLVVWPESVVCGNGSQVLQEAGSGTDSLVKAASSVAGESVEKEAQESVPEEANMLIRFLETDSCQKKLEILQHMRNTVTVSELDSMSISLDLDNESGSLEERYYGLERYLKMRIRFEGRR